uniref:rac guanine nucleotide exchange factor JJ-like n=1 Tax=Oncorhynchus gorbuscha TaxID=8017 RepID=UPI001EAF57EE|nr:rac guanine nucleotide exchange factor JJ-like [Oncorhynchus gorbuscha]
MSERGSFTKGDRDGVGQVEQLQQHLANFEPSSEQTEQQEEAQTGVESLRPVNDDTEAANEIAQQEPRKGERVRRLTEKGRELRDERWRQLEHRFRVSYEKWKALVKEAKLSLTGCCSEDLLEDLLNKISHTSTELNLVYVNLRQIDIPDNDIRRRVDTCEAVTMSIIKTVRCHLKGREEGQSNQIELHWKDSNSLCMSELSHKSSLNYQPSSASSQSQSNSKVNSRRSSVSSVKRQEAAAEVAANQAALEVMVKQERQLEELQRLEDEDKKRTAEQEAEAVKRSLEEARLRVKLEVENAARRRTLEDKRRELERLEVLKKLNAAKARMQVYEQDENSEDEKRELLSNCKSVKEVTHRRGSFQSLTTTCCDKHTARRWHQDHVQVTSGINQ